MVLISFKYFDAVPVRFNLWVMIFASCWVAYMLRVNMSLNIIAMVPQPPRHESSGQCGSPGPLRALGNSSAAADNTTALRQLDALEISADKLNWTGEQQALIIGAYFWSYPVTSLLGGPVAERWGPRYMVFYSSVAAGVLTALGPPAARLHYLAMVVVRFLLGMVGGVIYPALHVLVARWVPPAEKGKFISATMGGALGTVVTWSVTGWLMQRFGWAAAFYVPAAITLVWSALWWYLVADTPQDHPRISEAEKKFILSALGDRVKKNKGLPPIRSILTSLPFLAMVVLHFGNLWGLNFILTVGPKFVSDVLGFQLAAAGVVSALPYLARMLFATAFGAIGDFILTHNYMTITAIRKWFTIFSHVLPGVLLIVLVNIGCSTGWSVALITLSMGCNGASTLTNLQNHQDLAPNYAGTLYGAANFVGSTAGFFTPMITAYYTRGGVGITIFFGYFLMYVTRYNISVHIVEMTNYEERGSSSSMSILRNSSDGELLEPTRRRALIVNPIVWDDMKIAHVFAAYHIGFCICFPIFHSIGDSVGPTWVVGIAGFVSGALTAFTPTAARFNFWLLFAVRVALGFCAGAMQPSMVQLLRHWVPPTERNYFVWAYCGITMGTCATFLFCAAVQYYWRWPLGFYIAGAAEIVWVGAWLAVVADTPEKHPFISKLEREYLRETVGSITPIKKMNSEAPWSQILRSLPFWMLCVLNFGYAWLIISMSLYGPVYYTRMVNYELYYAAVVTALPFLLRSALGAAAIHAFHWYKYRRSTAPERLVRLRRCMIAFSHIVPGLLLSACWCASVRPGPVLLTSAVAMTAFGMDLTYELSYILTPNYFTTVHTVVKILGTTPGIISSYIFGLTLRNYADDFQVWKNMWCWHGTVLWLSGAAYLVWGRAAVQPWNARKVLRTPRRRMSRLQRLKKFSILSNIVERDEEERGSMPETAIT